MTSLTSSNEDRCAASLVPPVLHAACLLTVSVAPIEMHCDILAFAMIMVVMMMDYGGVKVEERRRRCAKNE